LDAIEGSSFFAADITQPNFNVTYEIGFAIGRRKPILLIRYAPLTAEQQDDYIAKLGIFDTLGYEKIHNSGQLAPKLLQATDIRPIPITGEPSRSSPVYLLDALYKTNEIGQVISRLKKTRLRFRSFDPSEQPRLSPHEAIRDVSQSYGVLLTLVPSRFRDSLFHNLRAAFIAGLAAGLDRVTTILQFGDDPVPLDYRDLVSACYTQAQIDEAIADFAPKVVEAFQEPNIKGSSGISSLGGLNLGAYSAENEFAQLGNYYLETDAFKQALRGETRIIVGRKGSGKSALFFQARDYFRQDRQALVLDLKPDGYQLLEFKDKILSLLERGSFAHTVTAFWQYVLLLEITRKILHDDAIRHVRDRRLYEPYQTLREAYGPGESAYQGDFAERVAALTDTVAKRYREMFPESEPGPKSLTGPQITELLYKHDVGELRNKLEIYLSFKSRVWLLFDNIDKGWPPQGLSPEDVTIVRCLLEATRKLEDQLSHRVDTHAIVFLRQDVYEALVEGTSDRGKEASVRLDWEDPDLLRQLLAKRLAFSAGKEESFEDLWHKICVSHINGEETSQFLIERCLMRPRQLIQLLIRCRGYAVNFGHSRIELEDIEKGLLSYSRDLIRDIGLEIRDITPALEDVMYAFIEAPKQLSGAELEKLLRAVEFSSVEMIDKIKESLLWYGVLGLVRGTEEITYIYDLGYDMDYLKALVKREEDKGVLYAVNPAFWSGLGIR